LCKAATLGCAAGRFKYGKNQGEMKMSDVDKNEVQNICWKTIFIAIALLAIGAVFGHVMTMKCCPMMMGPWGDGHHGMKACWDKGERECKGMWEHKCRGEKEICGKEKGWFEQRVHTGKCEPNCTYPKCSGKEADLSEPSKACPMMKEGKPEKD
jgi:hypothetical protein